MKKKKQENDSATKEKEPTTDNQERKGDRFKGEKRDFKGDRKEGDFKRGDFNKEGDFKRGDFNKEGDFKRGDFNKDDQKKNSYSNTKKGDPAKDKKPEEKKAKVVKVETEVVTPVKTAKLEASEIGSKDIWNEATLEDLISGK